MNKKRSSNSLIIITIILLVLIGLSTKVWENKTPNEIHREISKTTKKRKRIVLVHFSSEKKNLFWQAYSQFMQVAANDLGMELEVHGSDENHIKMTTHIKNAISGPDKADVLVFHNYKKMAVPWIEMANKAKVPVFLCAANLSTEEQKITGAPRKKYKYWIGQMAPNDVDVGYKLANELANNALPNQNRNIYMLALQGTSSDEASINRVQGLLQAKKNIKNLKIIKIIPANWLQNLAKERFMFYKTTKYPQISAVWSASDQMALGVIEGAKNLQIKLGTNLIVGSVDWIPEVIEKIENNELFTSIGGHFMEGGWICILLYDYLNGKDFDSEGTTFKTEMMALKKTNIKTYKKLFVPSNWSKINFKKFSKVENPDLKKYNFKISKLIQEIEDTD